MRKKVAVTCMMRAKTGGPEESTVKLRKIYARFCLNKDTANTTKQAYKNLNHFVGLFC
jgi:hypothetical protein